jgi:uncharacterized HAD superfamily protein
MTATQLRVLSGGRRGDPDRPLITVDMDGVLCEPPLGMNLTVHGPAPPSAHARPPGRVQRWLWRTETVRYAGRRCMPGAPAFLRALAPQHRLYLLTARGRPSALRTRAWLERNGLWHFLDGLVFRERPETPSWAFKAASVGALQPSWHVDDDGRTALHVVRETGRPVVLVAWPRNAGEYPSGIVRVPDLAAAAEFLVRAPAAQSTWSSASSSSLSSASDSAKTS